MGGCLGLLLGDLLFGGLEAFELTDAGGDGVGFGEGFGERPGGVEDAQGVVELVVFGEAVGGIEAVGEVFGLDLDGGEAEAVGFGEVDVAGGVEVGERVVAGGEGGVEFDGGFEAFFDGVVVCAVAGLKGDDGEVVVGEIAGLVEGDGLAVPRAGGVRIVLAEFEVAHGFVGEGVVGLGGEDGLEEGLSLVDAADVEQDAGADGVGLGGGNGLGLEGVFGEGDGVEEAKGGVVAALDVEGEGLLQFFEVAEGGLRGGDGILVGNEAAGVGNRNQGGFVLVVVDFEVSG